MRNASLEMRGLNYVQQYIGMYRYSSMYTVITVLLLHTIPYQTVLDWYVPPINISNLKLTVIAGAIF